MLKQCINCVSFFSLFLELIIHWARFVVDVAEASRPKSVRALVYCFDVYQTIGKINFEVSRKVVAIPSLCRQAAIVVIAGAFLPVFHGTSLEPNRLRDSFSYGLSHIILALPVPQLSCFVLL